MVTSTGEKRETVSFGSYLLFLAFFIIPFLGFVIAMIDWWKHGLDPFYPLVMVIMYTITGLGITGGYHRLFTHESFKAKPWVKLAFGIAGSAAVQGQIFTWVVLHDIHHKESDKSGDPHSPIIPGKSGLWAVICGFCHVHFGWVFKKYPLPDSKCARRLQADPIVRFVDRYILVWIILSGVASSLAGYIHDGSWRGAWLGFLWGGLVRVFFHQHATSSVNSVCHLWGKREFHTGDHSTNNILVALITFGEGAHNSHHAFMRSALHYLDKPWLDGTYLFTKLLEKCNLVWDVQVPSRERIEQLRIK